MSQSWDTLRKDARRLETDIDAKLVTYSKLTASLASSSSRITSVDTLRTATSQEDAEAVLRRVGNNQGKELASVEHMTGEMEILLAKLQKVVDAMSASLNASSTVPPPAALAHTLQRHTEILHDYTQEFRKARGSVSSVRERADLLSGATSPAVKQPGGEGGVAGGGSAVSSETLFAERSSLNGARVGADAAVQTGLNIKDDLERQRALFASMVERMETMSEGMPAVNRLIGQIRRKRKRDLFVLAAVIGILLFITFTWKVI